MILFGLSDFDIVIISYISVEIPSFFKIIIFKFGERYSAQVNTRVLIKRYGGYVGSIIRFN